jgi:hypothetical protein
MTRVTRIAKAHSFRGLFCLVAIIGVASGCVLLLGVSSAAAGNGSNCPTGDLCLYPGTNLDGQPAYIPQGQDNAWWKIDWGLGGDFAKSAYNNRTHMTWIGECDPYYCVNPPSANHHDCMNPGGKRLNLANWFYLDGVAEWDNIGFYDFSSSGTACS